MIAMAIAAFVLSWSPYCFVSIIATIRGTNTLTPGEAEIPDLLAKASVIYNPIVYTAMNDRFRASLLRMIPCCRYFARDINPAANTPTNSKSREENGNDRERKQSQTEVWCKDPAECCYIFRSCFPGRASLVFSFWQVASNFREECTSFPGTWRKPTASGGLYSDPKPLMKHVTMGVRSNFKIFHCMDAIQALPRLKYFNCIVR